MKDFVRKSNIIIKLIDIYGYITALYELIIKHNIGLGIFLTVLSLILSIIIYIVNNINKMKNLYENTIKGSINVSSYFIIISIAQIVTWTIVLFLWLSKTSSFSIVFLGLVFYCMPIIFIIIIKAFCYIVQENETKYKNISLIISFILSIVLLVIFLLGNKHIDIFSLIIQILFLYVPFYFALDI